MPALAAASRCCAAPRKAKKAMTSGGALASRTGAAPVFPTNAASQIYHKKSKGVSIATHSNMKNQETNPETITDTQLLQFIQSDYVKKIKLRENEGAVLR